MSSPLCRIGFSTVLLLAGCERASAEGVPPATAPAQNIALGRSYTFNTPPNYKYCTNGTESTKLTDGVYTSGYFWTQPTTAGWASARQVVITIDLGSVMPISGTSLNTAAGAGNALWPAAVDVLVSDDGQQYHYLGELRDMDQWRRQDPALDDFTYAVHRFWTDTLQAHGRYVAFAISPRNFTFVDEIEIYRGTPDLLNVPLPGLAYASPESFLAKTAVGRGIARRIRRDAALLRWQAGRTSAPPATMPAGSLEAIYAAASSTELVQHDFGKDFRALLPLTPLHRDLYRIAAQQMRAAGISAPVIQAADRWAPLPHIGMPHFQAAEAVDLLLMRNEYRAGAVNITNPLDRNLRFRLRFAGLPGGPSPAYVSVRQVEFTDTWSSDVVAAALPEARREDDAWTIDVPPGMTRQVWMTFHPTDIPPGEYAGQAELSEDDLHLSVPVKLHIVPLQFPVRPTLGLGGWDYTNLDSGNAVTAANRQQIITTLGEYFVDSPWATKQVLAEAKHDPVLGTMTAVPDTRRFDAWVRSWPSARHYCVFFNAQDTFQGFGIDRPQFTIAVQQWIRFWADHARQLGIKPADLYLLLVDEPGQPSQDRTAIAWAKAIHASGSGVTIWEDPVHKDPAAADTDLFALTDVVCPNRQILSYNEDYRRFFDRLRPRGQRLELYSASGPARSLDPYAYYRLQAWECWKWKARAEYFWSFCDDGGASSWNECVAPRQPFTPLFIDASSVTTSKQMEAIREGVEDYEYLAMLQGRIEQLGAQGKVTLQMLQAKDLLETAAGKVLSVQGANDIFWTTPHDRSAADRIRLEVLDMLIALQ